MKRFQNSFLFEDTPDQIINISYAYGGPEFFFENLLPQMNPDAIWRAVMLVGLCQDESKIEMIFSLLEHPDSRVRAWCQFALGQFQNSELKSLILPKLHDISPRVRLQAMIALNKYGAITTIPDSENSAHQIRLLISDDRNSHLDYLQSRYGIEILHATETEETLRQASLHKPDLIITDNQKGNDNLAGLNMVQTITGDEQMREIFIAMYSADRVEPIFIWEGGDYYCLRGLYPRIDWLLSIRTFSLQEEPTIHDAKDQSWESLWIYENWQADGHKIRIHTANCPFCNQGKGIHPGASSRNGKWHGPFASPEEALSIAENLEGNISICKHCSPSCMILDKYRIRMK